MPAAVTVTSAAGPAEGGDGGDRQRRPALNGGAATART
jgi:hypothetical protein